MRALIIGAEQIECLSRLKKHAEENRIDIDDMLDRLNRQAPVIGEREGFSCEIPMGYRVVFCIEFQKKGWARHVSVSIHPAKTGKCAHPAAIQEFMTHLGFCEKLEGGDVRVYFEDQNTVVNVIEYIKEENPGA